MNEVRELPGGTYQFEIFRNNNYLYVDKTDMIYKIVRKDNECYFLSRPRRFGKSLLISTIKAYFEGRKDLFEGLRISSLEKDWKKYPVIRFDLSNKEYNKKDSLEIALDTELKKYEEIYVDDEIGANTSTRFDKLIRSVYKKTGERVVILVDEYDVPLLEAPDDYFNEYRMTYNAFFKNIKSLGEYIRLSFLTGVTKFSGVSIFSTLNNVTDLTLKDEYSTLCGITEEELLDNFTPYIKKLASKHNLSFNNCVSKLKQMYDGYHFCEDSSGVYNPYSLINCFSNLKFKPFWFETGTPSFLIENLKEEQYDLSKFSNGVDIRGDRLLSYDNAPSNIISLLYQAGYLTISSYNASRNKYTLKYPNNEVESAFTLLARPILLEKSDITVDTTIDTICDSIDKCNIPLLIEGLKTLLSGCPYPVKKINEDIFRNYLYLILKVLSEDITCEGYTNKGRTDITLTNSDYVYIIELKVDKTAKEALKQIDDKGYAEKYKFDKRKVIKIGINYSNKKNNIESFLVK